MNPKKILVIEDEEGLVLSLEDRLKTEGFEITSCSDGNSGETEALSGKYDLILLDIMLPEKDGYQICESIRKAELLVPILMLTARSTNLDQVLGLRIGADDYLPKPFDMQVLLAHVNALLRRASYNNKEHGVNIISFGHFTLDISKHILKKKNKAVPLNAQEYRLLEFLVKNPDRIFSRDELLDSVWDYDSVLTTRTVDVHIAWLRQKLEEKEIPRHIKTIRGYGYKFNLK
ncbi:MAG: response regulator transcription factor [Spirochaetales bacterium]|nr:response regulator transcription factor [Spirochaetales bacterium]